MKFLHGLSVEECPVCGHSWKNHRLEEQPAGISPDIEFSEEDLDIIFNNLKMVYQANQYPENKDEPPITLDSLTGLIWDFMPLLTGNKLQELEDGHRCVSYWHVYCAKDNCSHRTDALPFCFVQIQPELVNYNSEDK